MLDFINNVFSFFGDLGEDLKKFILDIKDFLNFILSLPNYLPTPFKEIVISFVATITIALTIRIVLKIKGAIK